MDDSGVTRRVVGVVALPTAVALAGLAVAVGLQSGPTQNAAQARSTVTAAIAGAAEAAQVAVHPVLDRGGGAACTWFGLAATPATGMVAPELRAEGELVTDSRSVLDRVAQRLDRDGWSVSASGVLLMATRPDGNRLDVGVVGTVLRITGQAPCVWPEGERKPAP